MISSVNDRVYEGHTQRVQQEYLREIVVVRCAERRLTRTERKLWWTDLTSWTSWMSVKQGCLHQKHWSYINVHQVLTSYEASMKDKVYNVYHNSLIRGYSTFVFNKSVCIWMKDFCRESYVYICLHVHINSTLKISFLLMTFIIFNTSWRSDWGKWIVKREADSLKINYC